MDRTAPASVPAAQGVVSTDVKIFLTDDHAIVRDGLKRLIEAQTDMAVVGEAGNGEEAWRRIRSMVTAGNPPTVILMDVSMPGWNGTEATTRIRRSWPDMKVLALSMHEDRSYLRSLLEAGASGYILKRSAAEELIRAVRTVAQGGTYLDPALTATVMQSFLHGTPSAKNLRGELGGTPLSEREDSVLRLIAQGHTNKDIAVQLHVSVKTVETYKARSMEKLGLDSRAEIVRYALTKGWLN